MLGGGIRSFTMVGGNYELVHDGHFSFWGS